MDDIVFFVAALVALLLLVGWLQRRADRKAATEARARIADAEVRGSAKPLAQHPIINEWSCIGCSACVRACPEDGVLEVIEGIARVVHGSRCVGHERCAIACPVGAITIGLGELMGNGEIPLLGAHQESSVPGLFLAGEVSGIALIRHAVNHGVGSVKEIARRMQQYRAVQAGEKAVDVAIVGAGPAGMSAALAAIEAGLTYMVIEQDTVGGTLLHYPRQKLVMTNPVTLPLYGRLTQSEFLKEELLEMWQQIVQQFKVRVKSGVRLTGISGQAGAFRLDTTKGKLHARSAVLAVGRRGTPRKLDVPGEELPKVSYRLLDAAHYRHRKLMVVGGGDSAVEAAVGLAAQPGNTVHLSYRREHFVRIKRRNEEKLNEAVEQGRLKLLTKSQITQIAPDSVRVQVDGEPQPRELANEYVFVFAGGVPPFELLTNAGVRFS